MKRDFRDLRVRQLARSLSGFSRARREPRPSRGWLHAVRQGLGLSLDDVGRALDKSRVRVLEFERAEATDRITLNSLRRVAAAMDCDLVYAIVPRQGTFTQLAERRERENEKQKRERIKAQTRADVLDVEQTMALENQAGGQVERLIQKETKRRLGKYERRS